MGAWIPEQAHLYLFTVSATGVLRIYVDGQLAISQQGHPPRCLTRRHLYVGQSSAAPDRFFQGEMRKIQVWSHAVDNASVDSLFSDEAERALSQFATWFAKDLTVYTFGSLASYADAVAEDPRFAADLLLRVDVHSSIDGYDDIVRKVLSPEGLALTLGGPGKSWRRQGPKVTELEVACDVLATAEARQRLPWVVFGSGKVGGEHFCLEATRVPRLSGWPASRFGESRRQREQCSIAKR
eukprot:TRINITY_DN58471_c0_g1_i1.p1 TRINITY_DN58471_c0_g1~~TRINITY_DN58471_c0_g1_i1.p1  ORF type:complete len:252 (-),score=49.05 TRINITY_DN58471_c0_g1_i1:17-733(-)